MRQSLARGLPGLTILLVTLAGALPWGAAGFSAGGPLGAQAEAAGTTVEAGAVLPLAVVLIWGLWRPARTPAWLVFCAGLLADAWTAGPLGYWPLIYLLGLSFARFGVHHHVATTLFAGWLWYCGAALVLGLIGWAVSSLYQLRFVDALAIAWPMAATIAAFLPMAAVLLTLMRWIEDSKVLRTAESE